MWSHPRRESWHPLTPHAASRTGARPVPVPAPVPVPVPATSDAPAASASAPPPLLFKDKLSLIRMELGLAPSVAHEAIAEANRQLGIAPSGTPREQLDKLVEALR